jgi:DMSO/TMAO reductase YedYZ heme-binding membrane subunit
VWVFTLAFVAVHIVSLAADSYAGVGWVGAAVPGLSSYRMPAVAVGTFAAYALVLTGLSARFTKLLPSGWWLKLHRFAIVGLGLGWLHGVLSGSDTLPLLGLYSGTGLVVVAAAVYRYWFVRRRVAREARMRAAGPALRPALETEMLDA